MSVKNIINYINKRTDLYQEVLGEAKKIVNQINEESKYPLIFMVTSLISI